MSVSYVFPEGRRRVLTFSYDDGNIADRKLVDILTSCGMKGTFNLNAGRLLAKDSHCVTMDEIKSLYLEQGHEVACHGYSHPREEMLLHGSMLNDILKDRLELEKITGQIIKGMAYPFGSYSPDVIDTLATAGIVYCRTVAATNSTSLFPASGKDWLTWNPTCHHNGDIIRRIDPFLTNRYGLQMLYVWGHSYEFNNMDNWEIIEEFCDKLKNRKDVWYATNMEIYQYVEACRSLETSADCRMIHNPSCQNVFILADDKVYEIQPGATLHI